jgi:hypothetical protein
MALAESLSSRISRSDRKIDEPTWHREKDGKAAGEPSSIRADMETYIHILLTLGEDIFVSWASDHLQVPDMMRVAFIPEDKRNPLRPIKWTVIFGTSARKEP